MADDNAIEQDLERDRGRTNDTAQSLVDKASSDEALEAAAAKRESERVAFEVEKRRLDLQEQLHRQFIVSGSRIRYRDRPTETAFKDSGSKLSTSVNDPKATKAMLLVTEMKGWDAIKVSGHKDFRRQVWEEATAKGIKVRGYQPTKAEEQALEALLDKRQHIPKKPGAQKDQEHARDGNSEVSNQKRGADGVLVSHGPAPYQHDEKNNASYYVNLKTEKGDTTVWGVDLERAVADSKAQPGDAIRVERKGKEPVTVETTNEKGEKIQVNANRTRFDIETVERASGQSRTEPVKPSKNTIERAKTVERVADEITQRTVQSAEDREAIQKRVREQLDRQMSAGLPVPQVQRYDPKAPSQQKATEKPEPVVETNRELTR